MFKRKLIKRSIGLVLSFFVAVGSMSGMVVSAETIGTGIEVTEAKLNKTKVSAAKSQYQENGEIVMISTKSIDAEKDAKKAEKEAKKLQKEERKLAKKIQKEKHKKISDKNSIKNYNKFWNMVSVQSIDTGIDMTNGDEFTIDPVKVAILDSGVDYTEDIDVYLRKNFIPGEDEISVICEDISGHGTSVAGIIAAKDNEEGITGINPNVQLYSARILDENNQAPVSRVVQAIDWAIEQNVNIINISFGTITNSEEMHAAIKRAYNKGILIVAAAGNNGVVEYPAAYDEVIAVGAVNAAGDRVEGSAVGNELELVAPGEQIVSTGAFGGICVVGGTSLAAPHVTAIASILWQKDRTVSADFIRSLLAFSANQYGEDYEYGYGLVDLEFALNQFDAFYEVYVPDDSLNDQIDQAVKAGKLEINEKPVIDFEDVTYVEGSWGTSTHEALAGVNSIESGNPLSTTGMSVVKLGANKTDYYFPHMSYYPELHGFTSRQPNGNFEYFSNYVYSYIYLTEIAKAVYNGSSPLAAPHSITATCISSCKNHDEGWCVSKVAEHINSCFNGSIGLNNGEYGASVSRGASWDVVLSSVGNTASNRGLFIYGMALHTITDLFAHNAFDAETKSFIEHPLADSISHYPNRYACASLASQYVISHIKRQRAGRISDFYAVASSATYDGSFQLGRLNQYIKAVDSNYYLQYKSVFDNMTR